MQNKRKKQINLLHHQTVTQTIRTLFSIVSTGHTQLQPEREQYKSKLKSKLASFAAGEVARAI